MEVSDEDDWSDGWSEESRAFLDSLKRGDHLNDNFLKGVGHFMTERNEILRSENRRIQSELDALRGEVERQENLAAVYRRAQLNTEEKLKRETCNSEGWKKRAQHLEATIAQLRDRVAGLEEGLRCTLAYLPSTLGVTQRVRALLTQNEVG